MVGENVRVIEFRREEEKKKSNEFNKKKKNIHARKKIFMRKDSNRVLALCFTRARITMPSYVLASLT